MRATRGVERVYEAEDVRWALKQPLVFVILWTRRDAVPPLAKWAKAAGGPLPPFRVFNVWEDPRDDGPPKQHKATLMPAVVSPPPLPRESRLHILASDVVRDLMRTRSNVYEVGMGTRQTTREIIDVIEVAVVAKGFIPTGELPVPRAIRVSLPDLPEGVVLDVRVVTYKWPFESDLANAFI